MCRSSVHSCYTLICTHCILCVKTSPSFTNYMATTHQTCIDNVTHVWSIRYKVTFSSAPNCLSMFENKKKIFIWKFDHSTTLVVDIKIHIQYIYFLGSRFSNALVCVLSYNLYLINKLYVRVWHVFYHRENKLFEEKTFAAYLI